MVSNLLAFVETVAIHAFLVVHSGAVAGTRSIRLGEGNPGSVFPVNGYE